VVILEMLVPWLAAAMELLDVLANMSCWQKHWPVGGPFAKLQPTKLKQLMQYSQDKNEIETLHMPAILDNMFLLHPKQF
jgi:hypothetical protein